MQLIQLIIIPETNNTNRHIPTANSVSTGVIDVYI